EQHLPVRLRLEGDEQALVLEVAELVGHGQRSHVGQLDEAELELVLLELELAGERRVRGEQRGSPCREASHRPADRPHASSSVRISGAKKAAVALRVFRSATAALL